MFIMTMGTWLDLVFVIQGRAVGTENAYRANKSV